LDRISDWQYVAVTAGLCGLTCAVEGMLFTRVAGHRDLASLVTFWAVFTPMLCIACVAGRRRRQRRVRR
jgi:hypothetical protein